MDLLSRVFKKPDGVHALDRVGGRCNYAHGKQWRILLIPFVCRFSFDHCMHASIYVTSCRISGSITFVMYHIVPESRIDFILIYIHIPHLCHMPQCGLIWGLWTVDCVFFKTGTIY